MQRLLSRYGKLLLGLQEAMSNGVRKSGRGEMAPNWYCVDLTGSDIDDVERNRMRRDLLDEIDRFAEANEWRLPTRPVISLVEPAGGTEEDSPVNAEIVNRFGRIEIADDSGVRQVDLVEPAATIGRSHDSPPRDFVPVQDASRSLSREHLRLRFDGADWSVEICGRNPTVLNGQEVEPGSRHILAREDDLVVAPHRITLLEEGPKCRRS